MRKLNLFLISITTSLLIAFISFKTIFPFLYFLFFPVFNILEKYGDNSTMKVTFWIIVLMLIFIIYRIISPLNIFKNENRSNYISIGITFIVLVAFLMLTLPQNSNFPFKTRNDFDKEVSQKTDDFFANKYKFKKAKNYSELVDTITEFYKQKLLILTDQNDFNYYFKSYDIENKAEVSILVDTIVFNPTAEYFMATILIKSGKTYSQTSVIGMNKPSNIKVFRNDCEYNVSGSDLKSMQLSARQFFLIDFNKNEECRKMFNNFNPSETEYWDILENIIDKKLQLTNDITNAGMRVR